MTFLGDEGRDVLIVMHMIVNHKFTLLGPTASVGGFFLGPIYYYFMLPFLWAFKLDPVGPAVMVALFGIATIYLVYKTGTDFFNKLAGLIAASIYAASPLVIAYSRSSWNPNIVPFFSLCLLYYLWKLVVKPGKYDAIIIGIALGIGIQLHYLFLFLFVVVGVWYLLQIRRIHFFRTVIKTIVGFIIGFLPFLAFEVRHGFPNTKSIIQFLLAGKDTGFSWAQYFPTISDVIFRIFARLLYRIPEEPLWNNYPHWYVLVLVILTKATIYVPVLLFILITGLSFKKVRTKIAKSWVSTIDRVTGHSGYSIEAIFLLLVWFFTVILLFGLYRKAIYDYYFGIVFWLPFLFLGFTLSRLWIGSVGKVMTVILWGALLFFNWQGRPFVFPPNNQLSQIQTIARVALERTDGKPFNFALITEGNSDHAYRYFFEIWGRAPVTIEPAGADPDRKTVTNQLIVICETMNCKPLGNSLWEVAGFGRADIVGSWDVPFVKIYKLVHYKGT
jgi:4-amino-4-deoxy-L-arabinose transferase-like glycosyltransferase